MILVTIFVGFLVGLIADLLTPPGRDPGGWFVTTLLGLGGALLAHVLGGNLQWYRQDELAGFVASVLGAATLLALYRLLIPSRRLNRR